MVKDMLPHLNVARILVVEDDLPAADRVVTVLRRAGYYVQNASNSSDAFAADHARFDIGLVDGTMRDPDGRPILEQIKNHPTFAKLPLLIVTDAVEVPINGQMLRRAYSDSELLDRIGQIVSARKQSPRPTEPFRETRPMTTPLTTPLEPPRPKLPAAVSENGVPTEPLRIDFDARLQQQLAELKTLSSLGRSISSVLDLNEVLNEIVEAATTLTHAEEGLLLLPDDEGKALYIRAMKGIDDDSARNFRIKTEDPLVGRAYKTGEPVLVGDKGWQRVKTEYFVRSLLYVPLTYKGQTIGVLGVNNRRAERVFTNHDMELLLDLAAHAAIAVENARLYEERLLQNRQLTTLVEAGKAVNSTLALDAVLSTICQQIIQALNANACLITQQEGGKLIPLASTRHAIWRAEQGPISRVGERPMLQQALTQNAYYIVKRDSPGSQQENERRYLNRDGAAQMLVLPVRSGNQPAIGVLEVCYRGSLPEITGELRATLRGMALEITALVTQMANQIPLSAVLNTAQKILDAARGSFMNLALLSGGQKLVRIMEYGASVFLDDPRPQSPIFPPDIAVFGDSASLSYHAREDSLPDLVRSVMITYGAAAMLCLPLMIKGKSFGTVTVYDTLEARRFQPNEIGLVVALVAQAAAAIENARLYRDLAYSLTELKQTQANLVQAARLSTMGELAAVVAHQINNPLTTIMVDAEIILQDVKPGNPIHEGVTAILRSGQRAHTVVKRLLSTARRGAPGDTPHWIEVQQTLHHTLELVTTHIERSKVSIKIKLEQSQPLYVLAAPGHLEDLWLNLLMNARDALHDIPNATIEIHSHRVGDTIEFSIKDNGPGIPPDIQAHIFEPFFTTKPVGEGTGLGLYICKQIVDQCQGSIHIDTAPDQGACFVVTLPIRSQIGLPENQV